MLSFWDLEYSHPIKGAVLEAAEALIEDYEITVEKAFQLLEQIADYKGLYNALAIVYFACDDIEGQIDNIYERIIDEWENA